MSKIHVLSEQVANLIAAGEVIERPASVIKELLENALDANATQIEVEIRDSGFSLMRVMDNGQGMAPEDARMAFCRHATSKIFEAEDLNHILTFGFRGEALPSLASVARVELLTRTHDQITGFRYVLEANAVREEGETGCAPGATLVVRDLFFNTPARRKFMKSPETEKAHLIQTVEWAALANLGVRFRLLSDGKEVFHCAVTQDLMERIAAIYGNKIPWNLKTIAKEGGGVWIRGLAAVWDQTRPTRQGMLYFINGRPIEHRGIAHAVLDAYRPYLPAGRFPICFIFITIPPEWVDFNVHPAKREVRLRDEHGMHVLVKAAVQEALNFSAQTEVQTHGLPPGKLSSGDFSHGSSPFPTQGSRERIQKSMATYFRYSQVEPPAGSSPLDVRETSAQEISALSPVQDVPAENDEMRILGQIGRTYILGQDQDGFFIFDQHAVHERILFEKIRSQNTHLPRQFLLIPLTAEIQASRQPLLVEFLEAFKELGLEIIPFGRNTFSIQTQPLLERKADLWNMVHEILDWVAELGKIPSPELFRERALKTIACHAAVQAGDRLQPEIMESLIREAEKLPLPLTCPHGRPFVVRWSWKDLDHLFKRI